LQKNTRKGLLYITNSYVIKDTELQIKLEVLTMVILLSKLIILAVIILCSMQIGQAQNQKCITSVPNCSNKTEILCDSQGNPYWLNSNQIMLLVLKKTKIKTPGTLGKNSLHGLVTVKILIDENGKAICLRGFKGHPIAKAAVVSTLSKWKFKSYKINGQSISVVGLLTLPYDFRR